MPLIKHLLQDITTRYRTKEWINAKIVTLNVRYSSEQSLQSLSVSLQTMQDTCVYTSRHLAKCEADGGELHPPGTLLLCFHIQQDGVELLWGLYCYLKAPHRVQHAVTIFCCQSEGLAPSS